MGVGQGPEHSDREPGTSEAPGGDSNGRARGRKQAARKQGGRPSARQSARSTVAEAPLPEDILDDVAMPTPPGRGPSRLQRDRSLRRLLGALRAIDAGDFTARLQPDGDLLMADIFDVFNRVAARQQGFTEEIVRVSTTVGREGRMEDRVRVANAAGAWATSVDALNNLITDLAQPTTEVARVIKAVAEGDLSQKVELEIDGKTVQGEFFRIGSTVNRMAGSEARPCQPARHSS